MSQTDSDSMVAHLKNNPRMTGVLFTLLLLLSQAGTAAAGGAVTISGP